VFHERGYTSLSDLGTAYHTLSPLLGPAAAAIFAVSLLASGLSSSVVGTMAGQVVMQGFVGFSIPIWLRRFITMLPAVIVVGLGLPTARVLVVSQVVLSVVLAFAVVPLMLFTSDRDIMGVLVNSRVTTAIGWLCVAIIVALNLVLIFTTLGGHVPGVS
jgi:manganese transport protein